MLSDKECGGGTRIQMSCKVWVPACSWWLSSFSILGQALHAKSVTSSCAFACSAFPTLESWVQCLMVVCEKSWRWWGMKYCNRTCRKIITIKGCFTVIPMSIQTHFTQTLGTQGRLREVWALSIRQPWLTVMQANLITAYVLPKKSYLHHFWANMHNEKGEGKCGPAPYECEAVNCNGFFVIHNLHRLQCTSGVTPSANTAQPS